MKRIKHGLLAATIAASLSSVSAQADKIDSPLFLRLAEQDYQPQLQFNYIGKDSYQAVAELEKGTYHFRVADKDWTCGTSFGPSEASPIKFSKKVLVEKCAKEADFSIKIFFKGSYEFTLNNSDADKPTLSVMRQAKKTSFKRKPPEVECIEWDGSAVTTDVSSVFPDGTQVIDYYSGQMASVVEGKVSMTPAKESGGILLLEAVNAKESEFEWDNASVYFLITDRFYNGDPSNDNSYGRNKDGKDEIGTWNGGDFKGLTEKLDYIKDLGMTAIWINPMVEQVHGFIGGGADGKFPFYGYHGYWALDFTKIDKNFGDEESLRVLVDEAHKRGIRVVLDVVMNHVGYATLADLQDLGLEDLARLTHELPERWIDWQPKEGESWSDVNQFINYNAQPGGWLDWGQKDWSDWWGPKWVRAGLMGYDNPQSGDDLTLAVGGLPDFKTESEEHMSLPSFFADKEDTLAKDLDDATIVDYLIDWHVYWVRNFGIDGFRADTAKHIKAKHWKRLKEESEKALALWKAENPDKKMDDKPFWMVAEVWHHGAYKDYYFDNGFDSVLNFDFQDASLHSALCMAKTENTYANYAKDINSDPDFNLLTYISSHDTKLFYQGYQDIELQRNVANAFLMLPGQVQLYYGDETARPYGPNGGVLDQGTRSFMNWGDIKGERKALLEHWQKVANFRKKHLAIGGGTHNKISDQPYAFSRVKGEDKVVVVFAGKPK